MTTAKELTTTIEVKETLVKVPQNYSNNTDWELIQDVYLTKDAQAFRVNFQGKLIKLTQTTNSRGYKTVGVKTSKGWSNIGVHTLMYVAFHQCKLRKGFVVHHVDGNKSHNEISNLKMVTNSENLKAYFHNEGENDGAIANTRYRYSLEKMTGEEFFVSLPLLGLRVSNKGNVKSISTNRAKSMTTNSKFKTNIIVGYYTGVKSSSISLSRLYAKAFYQLPEDDSYKVLVKDFDESLTNPLNYYIVPSKSKLKA